MLRKILSIVLVVLLTAALGLYFYYIEGYSSVRERENMCNEISVRIRNPLPTDVISTPEIESIIRPYVDGRPVGEVDANALEDLLSGTGAVATAEIFPAGTNTMVVDIVQRSPIMRLETPSGIHFVDSCGFILPPLKDVALNLPIVTGAIPMDIPPSYRGLPAETEREWMAKMCNLAANIRSDGWWNGRVEQIWVEACGDVILYLKDLDESFNIGGGEDVGTMLRKAECYLLTIRPEAEKAKKSYTSVNLKYKDQIICK
ncbi:MAG: hypothetical protein HUJ91_02915 [Bacteroidales bacterium]|nr:hypothetical protein [Bacteroidales bacterium]